MVTLIAAVAKNMIIGSNGEIPWNIPSDLKWFFKTTKGAAVIMGRKTYESMGSRPLPKRFNVVVTSNNDYEHGCDAQAGSVYSAMSKVPLGQDIFIIGGAGIYTEGLKYANKMVISWVNTESEGDAKFPLFDQDRWEVTSRLHPDEIGLDTSKDDYSYKINIYELR